MSLILEETRLTRSFYEYRTGGSPEPNLSEASPSTFISYLHRQMRDGYSYMVQRKGACELLITIRDVNNEPSISITAMGDEGELDEIMRQTQGD